ncbi:MAG: Uma2 family endonuclease [Acidobacteria bacterium]|nr:Uma2 family endonuclease [Acidobacteriota bacterium]
MLTEELIGIEHGELTNEMPSFNHSYLCTEILLRLAENERFKPLVELTLDVDKGITPDISVFPKEKIKPNFFEDITRFPEMPTLAIEVISASQNIQDLLEKAKLLVAHGVEAVWTVEPYGNTVFVTTKDGEKRFHDTEIESAGIRLDFRKIFDAR